MADSEPHENAGEPGHESGGEPGRGRPSRGEGVSPPPGGGWITPPPEEWGEDHPLSRDALGSPAPEPVNREWASTRGPYPHRMPEPFRAPEPSVAPEPGAPPGAAAEPWRPTEEAPRKKRGVLRFLVLDVILPLAVAFGIAMFAQATVAKPYQIPSGSMLPTIQLQDRILADRLIYHIHGINRGDVIVFQPPFSTPDSIPYVKRVIGLPGDTVAITGGQVLVNGQPYVVPQATIPTYTMAPEKVPAGMLFVMGDNRNESSDSHIWGFVPENNVIGRADLIYWPIPHISLLGN